MTRLSSSSKTPGENSTSYILIFESFSEELFLFEAAFGSDLTLGTESLAPPQL